jgi:hypothetical protein
MIMNNELKRLWKEVRKTMKIYVSAVGMPTGDSNQTPY